MYKYIHSIILNQFYSLFFTKRKNACRFPIFCIICWRVLHISSAFELIIDRDADYENIDAFSMASDNVWCAGVILGNPIENWKNVDFNTLKSTLYWNDETPQEAVI